MIYFVFVRNFQEKDNIKLQKRMFTIYVICKMY